MTIATTLSKFLMAGAALAALGVTWALAQNAPPPPSQLPAQQDQPAASQPPGAIPGAIRLDGDGLAQADDDMKRVLDALTTLGGEPIESLEPKAARNQPTPTDAVKAVLKEMGRDPAAVVAQSSVTTRDVTYPGADGKPLPARIYTPANAGRNAPVIVYFHGGGWVLADIDVYDGGARALAKKTNAIVISADYRRAPEHRFPAAHDDAYAAYRWAIMQAANFGGDARRIAVAGESAGGNLAINVAIRARDAKIQAPAHMLLVYPVAGVDMNTPSYMRHAQAKPLNKPMMEWFVKHVFASPGDAQDSRLDLVGKADLRGLPDATVITADIDPLRSEGEMLAARLTEAGSAVKYENFRGATHEFFGMDAVVKDAAQAQDFAAKELKEAFAPGATGSAREKK